MDNSLFLVGVFVPSGRMAYAIHTPMQPAGIVLEFLFELRLVGVLVCFLIGSTAARELFGDCAAYRASVDTEVGTLLLSWWWF